MRDHPRRTLLRALTFITVPTLLLYAINRNRKDYWELPAWRRFAFWNIPLGNHLYLPIPKPFLLGYLFASLPEAALSQMEKKDEKAMATFGKQAVSDMSPSVIPTAFLPFIQWAANWSFWQGRPVVPESEQDLPPEAQAGPYTTGAAKRAGELLGVSPRKIDMAVNAWFGGLGRWAMVIPGKVLPGPAGEGERESRPWYQDAPVVRAFVADSLATPESIDRFYDALQAQERELARTELQKMDPSDEQLQKLYRLRWAARQLSQARKKIGEIRTNQNLSPDLKRNTMRTLAAYMTNVARAALDKEALDLTADELATAPQKMPLAPKPEEVAKSVATWRRDQAAEAFYKALKEGDDAAGRKAAAEWLGLKNPEGKPLFSARGFQQSVQTRFRKGKLTKEQIKMAAAWIKEAAKGLPALSAEGAPEEEADENEGDETDHEGGR